MFGHPPIWILCHAVRMCHQSLLPITNKVKTCRYNMIRGALKLTMTVTLSVDNSKIIRKAKLELANNQKWKILSFNREKKRILRPQGIIIKLEEVDTLTTETKTM